MKKYIVRITYKVLTEIEVEANNNDEAINKARNIIENSDMNIFNIEDEISNEIITMRD